MRVAAELYRGSSGVRLLFRRQEAEEEVNCACRQSAHLREQTGSDSSARTARRQRPHHSAYHSAHDSCNPLALTPAPALRLYFPLRLVPLSPGVLTMLSPQPEAAAVGGGDQAIS